MKNLIIAFTVSLFITASGIFIYHIITRQKTAYVKIGVVLQKYQGMLDANKQFASELSVVQGNVDTLRSRYENLKSQERSISPSGKAEWGYRVGVAEKEYMQYSDAADKQLQQRQQQLTADVLNTVNTYIQEYGKDKNFKMIFGTTTDGSILYGEEQDDLTETILQELNARYKKPVEGKTE